MADMKVSSGQIAEFLLSKGYEEETIRTLVAIAALEGVNILNNRNNPRLDATDDSYGLFQINFTILADGDKRAKALGIPTESREVDAPLPGYWEKGHENYEKTRKEFRDMPTREGLREYWGMNGNVEEDVLFERNFEGLTEALGWEEGDSYRPWSVHPDNASYAGSPQKKINWEKAFADANAMDFADLDFVSNEEVSEKSLPRTDDEYQSMVLEDQLIRIENEIQELNLENNDIRSSYRGTRQLRGGEQIDKNTGLSKTFEEDETYIANNEKVEALQKRLEQTRMGSDELNSRITSNTEVDETEDSGVLDGFLPIDLPKLPAVMTDEMVNSLYEMYGNADYFLGREDMRIFVGLDGKDIPKGERRVVGGQTITLFPGMNALLYASAMGYTEESQLNNVLEKTEWWKTRRPIERTFDTQWHGLGGDGWKNGDEWSIDQNDFLDEESKVLIDMAEDLGLDINLPNIKKMLKDLTYRSKRLGMSEREKKEEFMEIVKLGTDPDRTPGLLEGFEQEVTAAGNTWMVDVSEEEKLNLAKKRYYGDITSDAVNDILREQSRNMYPSLSSLIDQGYSPEAYFESYKTKGQNILERTLDFMGKDNNMFLKIAGDGPVGTTGLESPMSLASAGDFFRSQNEWRYTNNANDVAYDYADEIITMFGGLGGQARTSGTSSAYNV